MQLPELLQTIDQLKAEIDALRPLPPETEQRILQKFRLDWNYHSNAMEGNSLTQGETEIFLLEGLTAKGKPLKDHLDIKGHNTAIDFLLDFVRHPDALLTEADLRELHRILLVEPYRVPAETPEGLPTTKSIAIGEYKTGPNNVRTPTGEIHFYATQEETPARMGDLMRWYREESAQGDLHPVVIAAIFHHRFTDIHPFDDGNGRMSRLLMNLILMQRGYPPVVLRTQNRNEYLFALRSADQGDTEEFVSLIANNLVRSLELYLKGARGESLEEPDDIDKQVTLLKQELSHVEKPAPLTPENQREIFDASIKPLIETLVQKLSDFDDLFTSNSVRLVESFQAANTTPRNLSNDLPKENILKHLTAIRGSPGFSLYGAITIQFNWKSFTRAYFDNFSISVPFAITFEPLKYICETNGLSIPKFYQQSISREEIAKIVAKAKADCLEQIQQHRQPQK